MKLLFLLFLILTTGVAVYFYFPLNKTEKKQKKLHMKAFGTATGIVLMLLLLLSYGLYTSATAPDTQCTKTHATKTKPPESLQTALDYFEQGNYNYDIGNCNEAISDYAQAITLNKKFYQAYNNRAYTNMRMQKYKEALPDLNTAIKLNPNYVQAFMNRGDIHNYYYNIDRQAAISDYERVISIAGVKRDKTSVCGHLFLAEHNGWNIGTFIGLLTGQAETCR